MRPSLVPGFLSPELPSVRGPSFVGRILVATIRALPVRPGVRDSVYPQRPTTRMVGLSRGSSVRGGTEERA